MTGPAEGAAGSAGGVGGPDAADAAGPGGTVPDAVPGAGGDPVEAMRRLVEVAQYPAEGEFPVERGYVWTTCASVENGNPLYWDDEMAAALTGGPIAPPTMLSAWFRPHHWAPGRVRAALPLQVHFDLKERLGLTEAVMTDNTITSYEPVRPGDRLRTHQVLRSVSDEKTTKLGTGRFWVIDVVYRNQRDELVGVETYTGFGYRRATAAGGAGAPRRAVEPAIEESHSGRPGGPTGTASLPRRLLGDVSPGEALPELRHDVTATTVVLGAMASRDWRPMHHDKDFAVARNGTRDIFLNTPNQAAWFERYLTDWTGPHGRLGSITFRMRGSVFPGDTMVFSGTVAGTEVDPAGCGWVLVDVALVVDGEAKTTGHARLSLPRTPDDNPWARRGDRWRPVATGGDREP